MLKRLKDLAMDLVPSLRDYKLILGPQGDLLLHTKLVLADGKRVDLWLRRYKSRWDAAVAGGRIYAYQRKGLDFKKEVEIQMFRRSHQFEDYWAPWVWPADLEASVPVRLEHPDVAARP